MSTDCAAGRWTPERVCEAAIEAFRLLPTMPVYAPRLRGLAAVLPGQDIGPLEVLALSEAVLGRDAPERKALFLGARAKATGGDVGGSVSAYCRAAGVSENAFRRRRKVACRRIAEALDGSVVNGGGRAYSVLGGSKPPQTPSPNRRTDPRETPPMFHGAVLPKHTQERSAFGSVLAEINDLQY